MNIAAIQRFRGKMKAGEPLFGLWVTLESSSITEMAVGLGLDWVVIDAEHSPLTWQNIVNHIRAAVRSRTVTIVRLEKLDIGLVKRALDIGADGVAVPFIETADQLAELVKYTQYPPAGWRAVGGDRATAWGQCFAEHVEVANQNVIVLPNIETVKARQNFDAILDVPGTDTYFLGPADYSASAGFAGQWEGPGVGEALLEFNNKVRAKNRYCGIIAGSSVDVKRRYEQGFRMIAVGVDSGLLIRGLKDGLASVGVQTHLNPSFDPSL